VVRMVSLSKSWSVPGLKVGWMVADERIGDAFYEHASTSYGGPPSVLSSLVESVALQDRWEIEGREAPTRADHRMLEHPEFITLDELQRDFRTTRDARAQRAMAIKAAREEVACRLGAAGYGVVDAAHSVNVAVVPPKPVESYRAFLDLVGVADVAIYPSVLAFVPQVTMLRVTAAVAPSRLDAGLDRLASVDWARL